MYKLSRRTIFYIFLFILCFVFLIYFYYGKKETSLQEKVLTNIPSLPAYNVNDKTQSENDVDQNVVPSFYDNRIELNEHQSKRIEKMISRHLNSEINYNYKKEIRIHKYSEIILEQEDFFNLMYRIDKSREINSGETVYDLIIRTTTLSIKPVIQDAHIYFHYDPIRNLYYLENACDICMLILDDENITELEEQEKLKMGHTWTRLLKYKIPHVEQEISLDVTFMVDRIGESDGERIAFKSYDITSSSTEIIIKAHGILEYNLDAYLLKYKNQNMIISFSNSEYNSEQHDIVQLVR